MKTDEEELAAFLGARDAALRSLDVEWAIERGCPADVALPAMHKARYECTAIEPELRHASRAWLEANSMGRMYGFEWPRDDALPE